MTSVEDLAARSVTRPTQGCGSPGTVVRSLTPRHVSVDPGSGHHGIPARFGPGR